ncbi:MAG: histidine kinase [Bacteroidia bacterium]|nr:histidine kinase [Bacteroidia bacterium]
MKPEKKRMPESVMYFFIWLIFLIIPIITNNYSGQGSYKRILYDWLSLIPFILVFLFNNYLLLRKILFRGRTYLYVISLLTTVVIISMTFFYLNPIIHKNDPEVLENRILQDPQYGREEMRPGIHPDIPSNTPPGPELFKQGDNQPFRNRIGAGPESSLFILINTIFISLLLAGFNTAIAVTNKWSAEEQARKEIEKEHVESKLAFLQNQVNPHFLMNTLNNIHSLIEVDQHLAQNAVIKLSAMMRYLLYESGRGTTSLQREIEFLKSYLELMQLRVDKSVDVKLELPENFINVNLPPLLFISFIENAFKHGVSYREPSSLKFSLVQHSDSLEFSAENTIPVFHSGKPENTQGGFGLENVRKRLEMLYGTRHRLVIEKTDKEFRVNLIIPT